jgi:P4 family phage/plasmid primase-like protien
MTVQAFNTIQYCIDNIIQCFTFKMDESKACRVKWNEINESNFTKHLSQYDNGFTIITGYKYFVIDFDYKHNPPEVIYNTLFENCKAVEKTPGGYHFWFLSDSRTSHFTSITDAHWDNKKVSGIDIRAKGGICYCAPSRYTTSTGETKKYSWLKGNLSTATVLPSEILEHISYSDCDFPDTFSFNITKDCDNISESSTTVTDETITVLNGLSQKRVEDYSNWLGVGMALKNNGYSCELWDEWSRKSSKYKPGQCHTKWNSFTEKDKPLTKASLYGWLKEDNYELFISLQGSKQDSRLLQPTNASVAEAFFEMNPNKYLFSNTDGWYILQPNNTWISTGSTDILSIPNIINTINNECIDVLVPMVNSLNTKKEGDLVKRKLVADAIKKISSSSFLKGVTAFLPGLYHKQNIEKLFNEKRNLFAFNNGVIDVNNFTFRSIIPEDYITVTCGYDYREITDSEKDKVKDFLKKIWPNDAVLQYNLRAMGKSLTGENLEQIFHVFTGMGANGKSCLMDLCKIVFGDYYQTFSVTYLTKENDGKDKPLPELAAARYARMLVTSEPDERDKFQVNLLKNITGNEEVSFRGMYAKFPVKYVPQFKLWILTNDMPKLSKYDQAIERRMRCVHFPTRFVYNPRADNEEKRDDTLTQQFRLDESWKYGLLGLLIDAMKELGSKALEMPEEVKEFTEAYMLENNPVGAWLRQNYDITGNREDCIQKTELYQAFLQDTGIHKTQKSFSEDIVKCNINEKKVMGERYYFGLLRK